MQSCYSVAWTLVYFDNRFSTTFRQRTEKKNGPTVRAKQAYKPLVGAMFVGDRCDSCFLLPLGPTETDEDEEDNRKEVTNYDRMTDWNVLPIFCAAPLSKRWGAFRKIISRGPKKCITYDAVFGLMTLHIHRVADLGRDLADGLIIKSTRDLKLAAHLLCPHDNEQELEFDTIIKKYGADNTRQDQEKVPMMRMPEKSDLRLKGLVQTRNDLHSLLDIYQNIDDRLTRMGLSDSMDMIEGPFQNILAAMEVIGIGCSKPNSRGFRGIEKKLERRIAELEQEAKIIANDKSFLLSSSQQVSRFLHNKLKIKSLPEATESLKRDGHKPTLAQILDAIKAAQRNNDLTDMLSQYNYHKMIDIVLEFHHLQKILTTCVWAFPKFLIPPFPGFDHIGPRMRLHPAWVQTSSRNGRITCQGPNLHEVPVKETFGFHLRDLFLPSDADRRFFAIDYFHNEIRILAHMSGDEELIQIFHNDMDNVDIYRQVSSLILGKHSNQVSDKEHAFTKQVLLAILYGKHISEVARELKITKEQAKTCFGTFFGRFHRLEEKICCCTTGSQQHYPGKCS
mmetsp:Transcript_5088/g.10275  ORF Transcript_5088/g.10275 Transcript_5088/m.10275 type:complete len:564 (-) Transcript_5088:243-1934(-)